MCRSMVDIQSATAEIRRGKRRGKKERKKQDKNIMSASATQGGHKKSPSRHHRTTLFGCIFATKARIANRKKNFLSSNISTCPRNMVNFDPLTAKIGSGVWGTPANFNGFRVLAALLHDTLVVGVSQTAALNRRRHLYSGGRPSR